MKVWVGLNSYDIFSLAGMGKLKLNLDHSSMEPVD